MKPLLVRGLGRSGTTLLMSLLSTSKDVLCLGDYPFEKRYLGFFNMISLLFLLPKPADGLLQTGPQREGLENRLCEQIFPGFPFDTDIIDPQSLAGNVFVALWNQFANGILKDDPHRFKYYAEKSVGVRLYPHMSLIPHIVVNLCRDPRDIIVSVREFNAKRGYPAFGWKQGGSEMEYAGNHLPGFRIMLQAYLRAVSEGGEAETGVRYEDLVTNLEGEALRLERFLGTAFTLETPETARKKYAFHMTSETPESSIERWRQSLQPDVISFLEEKLGDELRGAGYRLSDDGWNT